ncbi:MAG: hypothetical protein ACYC2H_07220 [Thermoplasmatota archaeon]
MHGFAWAALSVMALTLFAGPAAAAPPDERALLVMPDQPIDLVVVGQGKPVRFVIGLNHGASLGGMLSGPKGCQGDDLAFNVIGVSTSGQTLAVATCKLLPAGRHTFHLDGGDSAFYGYARVTNATFA